MRTWHDASTRREPGVADGDPGVDRSLYGATALSPPAPSATSASMRRTGSIASPMRLSGASGPGIDVPLSSYVIPCAFSAVPSSR